MKTVHANAVFIREEAKLARSTHRYAFSTWNFTSFNSINFPEYKSNYTAGCKKLFAHMIMTWRWGALPIKAGTYAELKTSLFLKNKPENKKVAK